MTASAGPLEGLLVADFSRVLAGPFAAMTLGDLGAEVIKVERPEAGDDTRHWGPPWRDGESTYYLGLNRNKRSVALDLADPGDRELARELGARADVLIESFRPGLFASWGLDGEALRAAGNPRLVSCSITAFGSSERAAGLPGYDLLLQAMGGLMSVTGEAGGGPGEGGAAGGGGSGRRSSASCAGCSRWPASRRRWSSASAPARAATSRCRCSTR